MGGGNYKASRIFEEEKTMSLIKLDTEGRCCGQIPFIHGELGFYFQCQDCLRLFDEKGQQIASKKYCRCGRLKKISHRSCSACEGGV